MNVDLMLGPATWQDTPSVKATLACAPLLLYALAAGSARRLEKRPWQVVQAACAAAMAAALCSFVWVLIHGPSTLQGWTLLSLGSWGDLRLSVKLDAITSSAMLLVSFLGWVISRYSQTYMDGEPRQAEFVRSLMLTLAAVSVVVVSNNLGMLVLAWIATSLSLNSLLTFYANRPPALLVARKKALASRLAELCLLIAVGLVGGSVGSLEIDQLQQYLAHLTQTGSSLPLTLHLAAALLAVAAILKCAQLPVHGWLIQVMEAPTPVSALLHAGVVNLGGLVLIRLGDLLAQAPAAQTLLVVLGTATATVAALVMMTRVSVKVSLAWSTCAQMGFMLMQCGLGAYSLALLHLLAHSLYKAHAFLSAGGAVEQARLQRLAPARAAITGRSVALAALMSLAVVMLAIMAWDRVAAPAIASAIASAGASATGTTSLHAINETTLVLAGVLGLALTSWFTGLTWRLSSAAALARIGMAWLLALTYFGLHAAFSSWIGGEPDHSPHTALLVFVAGSFALLFVAQSLIRTQPNRRAVQRLYPWFYAGLHLDEWFTRLALRVWPLRLAPVFEPPKAHAASATPPGVLS